MPNLDKLKPGVPVVIGGQERRLVFDWWALSLIEEEKGPAFLSTLRGNISLPRLFFLAWAGLVHDNPELDGASPEKRRDGRKQVVEMCSSKTDHVELAKAVSEAILNSSPVKAARSGGTEKNAREGSQTQ